jgi:trimeric autotransporter adhesin
MNRLIKNLISVTILASAAGIVLFGCSTDSSGDYRLSTNSVPEQGGTVSPSSGKYDHGIRLEITAVPAEGYFFDRWESDVSGDENPVTITFLGNRRVTAVFEAAPFSAGNGSLGNPYTVSNFDDLMAISGENYLDKHFIQVNDIDASSSRDMGGFIHIGTKETPFAGTYDGNGYQITDLAYYEFSRFMGLFGYIQQAEIRNVTLASTHQQQSAGLAMEFSLMDYQSTSDPFYLDIDSENFRTGGTLVGFNDGGVIQNCRSYAPIGSRRHYLGGLVGYNGGEVRDSYATGSATGLSYTGGLVAVNAGLIQNSHATGFSSSLGSAGGLVGVNYGGQIINSYAKGDVDTNFRNGGLAAINTGLIRASYASGSTNVGIGPTGGLVGHNEGEIRDSYSLVSVTRYEYSYTAGGLVGVNYENGAIVNSFVAGRVASYEEDEDAEMGGISGKNEGTITASYWDTEATGQNQSVGEGNPVGAAGLTTQQMTDLAAQANMPEFDWQTVWRITDGYPVLRWQGGE